MSSYVWSWNAAPRWVIRMEAETRATQWLQSLLLKHEEPSLDPQHPYKELDTKAVTPSLRRQRRKIRRDYWPDSLVNEWVPGWERPNLNKQGREQYRKTVGHNSGHVCGHAQPMYAPHTQTHGRNRTKTTHIYLQPSDVYSIRFPISVVFQVYVNK